MDGCHYSVTFMKEAVNYVLQNCFFKVGSQILCHFIGIPIGSDLAIFFASLFLFHYKSEWIGKMKHIDHHLARMSRQVYRFIDDLITMNDNKEYENSLMEICLEELESKNKMQTAM